MDDEIKKCQNQNKFKIMFLGTGVSTTIPRIKHILDGNCEVCKHANENPQSKNRRGTVSVAIINEETNTCVIIDAGKSMRENSVRFLPKLGVKCLNGVLITHDHFDAVGGMDDLRDFQSYERVPGSLYEGQLVDGFRILEGRMDIFMNARTYQRLEHIYPYLVSPPVFLDEPNEILARRTAYLKYH